ncbi:Helix-turn-helix domain-containing protein [Paenibacillus sophorae]|uniref:Helix-turn-helix domain-containing protein n=1 Tax=Paenibacillus sophorae TaxID=1333845 RepID=A0A1H8JJ88_9BACL|nr:helix-turn-helix domain-containing protein [Paenibacillus sophorae]SEN80327.1 Helix-turn-helix domain-containing protein [Paenibacillus sophorae]
MAELQPQIEQALYANIFDLQEASQYLKVSDKTLRRMTKDDGVPHFWQRGQIFFRQIALDRWISEKEQLDPLRRDANMPGSDPHRHTGQGSIRTWRGNPMRHYYTAKEVQAMLRIGCLRTAVPSSVFECRAGGKRKKPCSARLSRSVLYRTDGDRTHDPYPVKCVYPQKTVQFRSFSIK